MVKQRFVALQVDLTDDNPDGELRRKLFGGDALPVVGFIDSSGNPVTGNVIGVDLNAEDVDAEEFIEMLEAVK